MAEQKISNNLLGALWMIVGALSFSISNALVKKAGVSLPSIEIVFFRCFFQFLIILPYIIKKGGFKFLKTKQISNYFWRLLFGIANMTILFYVITQIPLATAIAISFSRPLFVVILAFPLLGEKVGWRRAFATMVGFVGVLVILNPAAGSISTPAILAVITAVCLAITHIFIKRLSVTENPIAMVAWFSIVASIISLPPTISQWVAPNIYQLTTVLMLATLGCFGQYCTIQSYYHGEATIVGPFDYLQILFSGILGIVFFSEMPNINIGIGALIIIASSLYILKRETIIRKKLC